MVRGGRERQREMGGKPPELGRLLSSFFFCSCFYYLLPSRSRQRESKGGGVGGGGEAGVGLGVPFGRQDPSGTFAVQGVKSV